MLVSTNPNYHFTLQQQDIITRYLSGAKVSQIAAALGLSRYTIYQHLRHPKIKAYLQDRFIELQQRVLEFKLQAVEEAESSLDKIINLRDTAKEEKLQRDCAKDVIEIAGLLPRKRILVETDHRHGIDQDTLEFMHAVAKETGLSIEPQFAEEIIDAELDTSANNP